MKIMISTAAALSVMLSVMLIRAEAAPLEMPIKIVVLEFGAFQGIDVDNLKVEGSERVLGDIVENLFADNDLFMVMHRDQFLAALDADGVNYKGSLSRKSIARINELINVPYIV